MEKTRGSHKYAIVLLLGGAAAIGSLLYCQQNVAAVSSSNPKGHALAIGLNRVDPAHYKGRTGRLPGCEADANDMAAIASSQGLEAKKLLTAQATRANVLEELGRLAQTLKSGDLLVVSYSGHGGQVRDQNGDEEDGLDETWCLYDGQLIDDELFGAWMKFSGGVRILVFSDSCHSGTITKMLASDMKNPSESRSRELDDKWMALSRVERAFAPQMTVPRSMSPTTFQTIYRENQDFYDKLGKAAPKEDPDLLKASRILISACQDEQTALDIGVNGLFTSKLKEIWNEGAFAGDHRGFYEAVRDLVRKEEPDQVPNFREEGGDVKPFAQQRPYTVQ